MNWKSYLPKRRLGGATRGCPSPACNQGLLLRLTSKGQSTRILTELLGKNVKLSRDEIVQWSGAVTMGSQTVTLAVNVPCAFTGTSAGIVPEPPKEASSSKKGLSLIFRKA